MKYDLEEEDKSSLSSFKSKTDSNSYCSHQSHDHH